MLKIRKFKKSDIEEVVNLIRDVYKEFNNKEGTKEAVQKYIDYYDPSKNPKAKLIERFLNDKIFYVATKNNKIIGIIRGQTNKITNLFVNGKHHKQGIGKKLVTKFETDAKKQGAKEIKIKASLYATKFYQKLGYKKTTGIRNFRGLKMQPMLKKLI